MDLRAATKARVRAGLVGGGEGAFIGQVHLQAMRLDGRFELVCGAFSRNPENNRQTASALHLDLERCYDSWEQLLAGEAARPSDERLELLVIVTPNHLHAPIAKAALESGFHVFSEKPAALSLADTRDLAVSLARSACQYGLAHTYQGYPMVWQAQHMVATGALGRLRKIYVEYPQGWLSEDQAGQGNKQAAWRGDPSLAGPSGCMGDIGVHAFNLAEFVSGQRISQLCADLGVHVEGRQLDDDGAVLFRTDAGASGVLIASQICSGEENALTLRLYGERGGLEWRQQDPGSLHYRRIDGPVQTLRAGTDQSWLCEAALKRIRLPAGHPEGYIEAMANLYTDLASSIRDEHPSSIPGIDAGLRGMAFIETVLASHRSDSKWTSFIATER